MPRIDSDAMTASEAWTYLHRNPGMGCRARGLEFYAITPSIVEVSRIGTVRGTDIGRAEMLNDFSDCTFYPLDTTDYAA